MTVFWHEIRRALGQLRRSTAFTVLAVVILGFGLGATLYMFTVVKAYVLTPLPYPAAERIMHLGRVNPLDGLDHVRVPPHDYLEWRKAQQSFAALTAFYTNSVGLSGTDLPERVNGAFVTPSVFDVVQSRARIGRTLLPADAAPGAAPVIVLGFDLWMNRYNGDPAILGESVRVNGVPTTIVGVMPSDFRFPFAQEVWVPLRIDVSEDIPYLGVVGRLQVGVTLEQARSEFANIAATLAAQYPENRNITTLIRPYRHAFITAETRAVIWVMFAAVLFVLLIACSNVANLMLARTVARQKDIALRTVLGADRRRIMALVLTESLVLALGGATLAYFLADVGLDLTRRAFGAADIEEPFWVVFEIDGKALLFVALAAVVAGLVAGLPPALHATRTDVNEYLKEGSKGGGASASRLSRTFVTAEIALSCILLVCTALMIQSVAKIDSRPLGIENRNLLTGRINLPQAQYPDATAWYRFFEQLVLRLEAHPDVLGATAAYSFPGMNGWIIGYRRRGVEVPEGDPLPLTQYAAVMDNYAEALGLQLLRGRWFDARDNADSEPVAIIDARFAAQVFPGEDPIGRQIAPGPTGDPSSRWRTIVGVTEDTFMDGIDNVDRPATLVPLRQEPYPLLSVAVHTRDNPLAFSETLRETVHGMDPDVPVFWVRSYDNWIWAGNFSTRSVSFLFSIFAIIAVVLAAAGIYGVLTYSVSQRTREIGVRRAMGALDGRILNMVLGRAVLQLGIGLGAGLLCAIVFARLLSGYLHGVSPFDPFTLIVVALILFAVALLASLVPALRATRVHPMEALRYE